MSKRLLAAAVLAGMLGAAGSLSADTARPAAPPTDQMVLTLPQIRVAAARAIALGQYDLALAMARAMLEIVPDDSYSHYIIAQAFLRNGQPQDARPAARLSYKLAQTPAQKHESARIAALTATAQQRYFSAQIWMRRAYQAAPTPEIRARTIHEFRAVRAQSPLNLKFGFSVTPSSNVNGGAAEELYVVDGLNVVGILSPDAQALSGTEARGDVQLRYRLRKSETSQTHLRSTLQVKRVELSAKARDKAPNARSDTYNSTLLDIGISHTQRLTEDGLSFGIGGFVGRAWYGGDIAYDYTRAEATLFQPLGDKTALSLGFARQDQRNATTAFSDVSSYGWRGAVTRILPNDDQLTLSIARTDNQSDNNKIRNETRELRLGYARAEPVGPVRLSAALAASERHYESYSVIFPVPGGRTDMGLSADLDLTLHKLDYIGFVPTVRLSADHTDSNVSRFDTEEFSISIGFASAF